MRIAAIFVCTRSIQAAASRDNVRLSGRRIWSRSVSHLSVHLGLVSAPSSLPAGRPEGRNAFIFIRRCCVCLGHTRLVAISLWLNYKLWQSFRLECWDETTETSEVWSVFDRGVVGSNGRFVLHSPDLSLESWDFSFSLQFESSALSQFWVLSLQPSVDVANPLQRPCSDNAHAYKHENFQPKHLYGERTKNQQTEKVFHFAPT